ncbi:MULTISPECIES: ribonuclease HII [Methanobacterium]|jgi:ribonuclease HII|uniref:Ribonuclease HII n=1 Tax=Methanobacterium spitsbergense TaxID=2874285 RepID=A0A8T5UN50_9EURY|nr:MULTISPECIES: ribonuclease HII [Methanobacterium]MBZ2165248.1 ribonuclease HII [Methanobacterium spitsbergense]
MKLVGIDEAGRGSVLGPLVVCGVAILEERLKYLDRLKLRDSKKISPKRRVVLSRKIRKIAECHPVHISATDIDLLRSKDINLNEIEKIAMRKIIGDSNPDVSYIDCIDVKPERFKNEIEKFQNNLKVVAEHGADDKYAIVSAASIVAKVERDMEINKIKKEFKDIGSGYPSDPKTISFLKNTPYNDLPDFVRRSWATVERMK